MKCPKCKKGTLYFGAYSISPDCFVTCNICGFTLESEVSWEGCKNEREHDNKCVEHLMKLLKEE